VCVNAIGVTGDKEKGKRKKEIFFNLFFPFHFCLDKDCAKNAGDFFGFLGDGSEAVFGDDFSGG
jgi:hypothetical protein